MFLFNTTLSSHKGGELINSYHEKNNIKKSHT